MTQTEKALHGGHGFPLKNTEKLMEFLAEIDSSIPGEFAKWASDLIKQDRESRALKPAVSPLFQKDVKVQEGVGKGFNPLPKRLGSSSGVYQR